MEHSFLTKRRETQLLKEGVLLVQDIMTVANMSSSDLSKLVHRQEADVDCAQALDALQRLGIHVGTVVRRLRSLCIDLKVNAPTLSDERWHALICKGMRLEIEEMSSLELTNKALSKTLETTKMFEEDTDESSYSDYSDSNTCSSEEESSETETNGEESDEETDDEYD